MRGTSFQERFRSKPENVAKAATEPAARVDRSAQWYVKLHLAQRAQLKGVERPDRRLSVCTYAVGEF
jgi:hypothetical protein